MNHYAFRVYRGSYNNPRFAGTVSAESMGKAVKTIMTQNKITVLETPMLGQSKFDFMLDGQKVGILIYANPEDYIHG